MKVEELFTDSFMARAGFRLLASSTRQSFLTSAQELAEALPIRRLLGLGVITVEDLTSFARTRWSEVLKAEERDAAEVKLSVLLPTLARLPDADAGNLVRTIAMHDRPPTAWLGALARWLYRSAMVSNVDARSEVGRTVKDLVVDQPRSDSVQGENAYLSRSLYRLGGIDEPRTIRA